MSELALIEDLGLLTRDPFAFVLWAFPWGEEGELRFASGPEPWQAEVLQGVRDGLLTPDEAIRWAIASGHGIGKSSLVSWLILWAVTTRRCRGVVTANTENQLKTKTWAELGKWYRLFLARDLFKMTATSIFNPQEERDWRIDMVPWSERNTEAFQGLHNKGARVLLVFDEASSIPDLIWEVAEGALTDKDTEIVWLVCGNPTRNTGRFRECFGRHRARWRTKEVDSREVSITNKAQIAQWVADYGEDSDFVRVRVRGVFPRAGSMEFIPAELVNEARSRPVDVHRTDPFIIGVDVARFGEDASVIWGRKGRDARSTPPILLRGVDTMVLAARVAEEYLRTRADAIFVDEGGVGGGVVDRLRMLHVPVVGIQFGGKADRVGVEGDLSRYANKRAEMWGSMREWLKGGAIPDSNDLADELVGPQYALNLRDEIQLERKADMKKRGLASPDQADALALTFAYPVMSSSAAGFEGLHPPIVQSDYNPYARELMEA